MTNDDIEPLVPVMPRQTSTGVRADGGPRERYDPGAVAAPLVPDY